MSSLMQNEVPVVTQAADRTANRQLLDSLAGSLSPAPELLMEERAEHALMFNLLGIHAAAFELPERGEVVYQR